MCCLKTIFIDLFIYLFIYYQVQRIKHEGPELKRFACENQTQISLKVQISGEADQLQIVNATLEK